MLSEAEENLTYWMKELLQARNRDDRIKAQFFVKVWKDQVEQDVKLLGLREKPNL